jgi:hypothetical protein
MPAAVRGDESPSLVEAVLNVTESLPIHDRFNDAKTKPAAG